MTDFCGRAFEFLNSGRTLVCSQVTLLNFYKSKTFLNEVLNRNLDNKPWSPGAHSLENFGWEKKDD